MFTAALFIVSPDCSQSTQPLIDEWLTKILQIHTLNNNKKNLFAIQVIFKTITLCRGSQTKEYIPYGIYCVYFKNRNNYIVLKTKVMIA